MRRNSDTKSKYWIIYLSTASLDLMRVVKISLAHVRRRKYMSGGGKVTPILRLWCWKIDDRATFGPERSIRGLRLIIWSRSHADNKPPPCIIFFHCYSILRFLWSLFFIRTTKIGRILLQRWIAKNAVI